jgi:hypothetical protein
MSQCFGIKITLQDKGNPVIQNTTIGLYNVTNDNSEFRWTQNDILGLSGWKSGMIIENGIEHFSIEIDLTSGGNISYPGRGVVSIKNNLQFHQTLQSKNINLAGLKLEIYHFSGSTEKKYRSYICEEPTYNSKKFTIPFKGGQERRVSNILNMVTTVQFPYASSNTVGKPLPATFGKLIPAFSDITEEMTRVSIAKFNRTNDRVDLNYYSDDFFTGSGYTKTISFPITDIFTESDLIYKCEFRGSGSVGGLSPVNTFVKVVDGVGKGQIRKINAFSWTSSYLLFSILDFFETELLGADTEGGRSWVQFIRVYRRYDVDHWPCGGFYDSDNDELVNGAEFYTFTEEDGLLRAAPYGYEFYGVNAAKNQLEIDPKLFDQGNLDTQNSFMILPVENLHAANDATLVNWKNEVDPVEEAWFNNNEKHITYDGLYSIDDWPTTISGYIESNKEYANDKISSTYYYLFLHGLHNAFGTIYEKVIYFDLPSIPKGFTFSNCYIGLKIFSKSFAGSTGSDNLFKRVMLRKFKYGVKVCSLTGIKEDDNGVTVDNVPDFYFVDNPQTGNENFFQIIDEAELKTGYLNAIFDTGITSKEEYETYLQGCIWLERYILVTVDPVEWDDETRIYELCFIFKKSTDIGKNIYVPFHGRNIASSWQGRKSETTLIEHPIDLLEHICRLQDYRDTCNMPVSGWGLQYADNALIETNSLEFGTFENGELGAARMYALAGQIFEYDEGYTDKLKQTVCSEFALANWQSAAGKERVISLPENKMEPVYTITLDDILDRSKIEVKKISSNKIYAEPFVNYNKNPATEKYDNTIIIKNTSATFYQPDYVIGIPSSLEKEALWNSCHSLALLCHNLNRPSTDMTDLTFANGEGAYTIAYNYLKYWINWQFCEEIKFETHFNIAGSWQECTPINVLFSHQTNNISRSALIEESTVNPNHPYNVMIKAIMYA